MKTSHHNTTAADAEFLDQMAAASVLDLHRSNLLRLQMEQVVEECRLHSLNIQDANHVQWAPMAHEYIRHVADLIETISTTEPAAAVDRFPVLSDRAPSPLTLLQPLRTMPVPISHTFVSKPSGNANVLPTLQLVVIVPNNLLEAKDYMRHRYFDKRNWVVAMVAKKLEAAQDSIGQLYWEYQHGDLRKPILLLVPPLQSATTTDHATHPEATSNTKGNKKKSKRQQQQQSNKKGTAKVVPVITTKKLRFRLQILFNMESLDWIASPVRCLPNRCNLSGDRPSQFYNHALLEDAQYTTFFIDDMPDEHDYPHLRPTVLLAQIWCLKRGLLRNHDGWNTSHIALLILYLYRTKQANPRLAPPQLLAAWFKLLAQTNWLGDADHTKVQHKQPANNETLIRKAPSHQATVLDTTTVPRDVLVMPHFENHAELPLLSQIYADEYKSNHSIKKKKQDGNNTIDNSKDLPTEPATLLQYYASSCHYRLGPVFLDPTMTFNYFGRLSPSFIRIMQQEARKSLECLHSSRIPQQFDYLFRTNVRFWDRYDAYLQIPLSSITFGQSELWGHDRSDLGDYEAKARGLVTILTMALGDRIRAVRFLTTGNGSLTGPLDGTKDSDDISRYQGMNHRQHAQHASITGNDMLVLGVSINPDTCYRLVDRGPPADDTVASKTFLSLWGSKAELRRFKDGAIVNAVVWGVNGNDAEDIKDDDGYVLFHNDDKIQGGIVERIIRHILKVHFLRTKKNQQLTQFSLRNMASLVDSVTSPNLSEYYSHLNPTTAHRMVMKAFEQLSAFLRKHSKKSIPVMGTNEFKSRLELPLEIDDVEPLAPALRYVTLHPPLPHPLLGGKALPGNSRASGAVSTDPIVIQIRFRASTKWPNNLKAIGAAKTAMLIQLSKGLESMKQSGHYTEGFEGPIIVTPTYADIGFMGYVFRLQVRADPELKLLQGLNHSDETSLLHLQLMAKRHVLAATHHSLVHAVYTSQPSSSWVVRMATKWVSSHLLSDLIPFEAIELLVCHIYTEGVSPLGVPATFTSGFLRFLSLLAEYDWLRSPLIVDPQGQFTEEAIRRILSEFEKVRGPNFQNGPAMYMVSPIDRLGEADTAGENDKTVSWSLQPFFATSDPEAVILRRASSLAKRSYDFLKSVLLDCKASHDSWFPVVQETSTSFRSYSALLRVSSDLIIDTESSSTGSFFGVRSSKKSKENITVKESSYMRSMQLLRDGPKDLRIKLYRNLLDKTDLADNNAMLLEWRPIQELIATLRQKLGHVALFFYNDLCPDVIGVLWRPTTAKAFSAFHSEFSRPVVANGWKGDTLVTRNVGDVLREMGQFSNSMVVDCKVLDWGPQIQTDDSNSALGKRKTPTTDDVASDSESEA